MPLRAFDKRVAVVTGAARGLGAALAKELAARGAIVALVDVDPSVIDSAAALGAQHRGFVVDVSDRAAVTRFADDVRASLGSVDLLVNNAGVAVAGSFESVSHDDFEWLMGVNFWGATHLCRALLPALRARPEAHIVNVCSSFAWLGFANKSAYCASKAALRSFSESLRAELSDTAIGVTLLFPGPLDTGLVRNGRAVDPAQREAEAKFVAGRAVSLERVVSRTLRAIARNSARVVVSVDYHAIDLAVRVAPSLTLAATARMSKRMPF